MSFHKILLPLAAMPAGLFAGATARAETVVTACGADTAEGGTNFESAIAAGGDIVIRCATGGDEIRFTRMHAPATGITIDGEKKASLVGPGSGPMFKMGPLGRLALKGLTIRNPPATPSDPTLYTGVVYGLDENAAVDLLDVQVRDTRLPFVVQSLRARNCSFERNGADNEPNLGVVMAAQMELVKVTFDGNLSRPFLSHWKDNAQNLIIRGRVADSVFRGNKRPAMWRAGTFVSDGNRYEGNGDGTVRMKPAAAYRLPDGRNLNDDNGPSMAGALELRWTRATINRDMFKGNRGMVGGAILVLHADVRLQGTELEDNQAAVGGAIASIRVPPRDASEPFTQTALDLMEVKIRHNRASHAGGALLVNGNVSGSAVLMSGNHADKTGGAIAWIGPSLSLAAVLPASLGDELLRTPGAAKGSLVLRESFLVDNESAGATVEGQQATMQFGNLIAARNETVGGAAVIHGASISLASATVAGNGAAGIAVAPGGSGAHLVNTIIADNAGGNCSGGPIAAEGANLQSPGSTCGIAIATGAPELDRRFEPGRGSPARTGGTLAACATDPLVTGIDAYGDPRGPASCAIGAVEPSLVREVTSRLPAAVVEGSGPSWLLFLVMIFFLICFILGWRSGLRRRCRSRAAAAVGQ